MYVLHGLLIYGRLGFDFSQICLVKTYFEKILFNKRRFCQNKHSKFAINY